MNCYRASLAIAWLFVALAFTACGKSPPETLQQPSVQRQNGATLVELPQKARDAIELRTEPARYGVFTRDLRTTAMVTADEYHLAHVSPRIEGRAVKVMAKLGDVVHAGQPLAEIDSIELGARKAAYLTARANYNVARRNYDREDKLFKQEISSEREYLDAKGAFERDEAALNAAREALLLLNISDAEIGNLKWSTTAHDPLSYFPLISPFAGTVIARHITLGELIQPQNTPFTVADLSTVWVIIDVYEKDLAGVALNDSVDVAIDAFPGQAFKGRIAYLSNVVTEATRTAPARVEIPNPDGRLRPGMFATVTVVLRNRSGRDTVLVQSDAIQQVGGKNVAFVEERPGVYAARQVALGDRSDRNVQVLSGIARDERVVTKGAFYLKSILLEREIGGGD